jgi:hypothetical protein
MRLNKLAINRNVFEVFKVAQKIGLFFLHFFIEYFFSNLQNDCFVHSQRKLFQIFALFQKLKIPRKIGVFREIKFKKISVNGKPETKHFEAGQAVGKLSRKLLENCGRHFAAQLSSVRFVEWKNGEHLFVAAVKRRMFLELNRDIKKLGMFVYFLKNATNWLI